MMSEVSVDSSTANSQATTSDSLMAPTNMTNITVLCESTNSANKSLPGNKIVAPTLRVEVLKDDDYVSSSGGSGLSEEENLGSHEELSDQVYR